MNRRFVSAFAAVCIVAALLSAASVAYRVLAADAAGKQAARSDFEALRSELSGVRSAADLAALKLRAQLSSRYAGNPSLLLVDVYERDAGDRWRIPAVSPYLLSPAIGNRPPELARPPISTILLSSPLNGDVSGKLAVDALYANLSQATVFEAFRDALIGLGAFLALAALVLAIVSGGSATESAYEGPSAAAPSAAPDPEPSYREEGYSRPAPAKAKAGSPRGASMAGGSSAGASMGSAAPEREMETELPPLGPARDYSQDDFFAEPDSEDELDFASAAVPKPLPSRGISIKAQATAADDEFDIPVMDQGEESDHAADAAADASASSDEALEPGSLDFELPVEEPPPLPASEDFPYAEPSFEVVQLEEVESVPESEAPEAGGRKPSGLYSSASGLGWESYMEERLNAEISRSASFEQDLSLLAIAYDGLSFHDENYGAISSAIRNFFSFRDLAFERGDDGFSIILPNIDSSHAVRMAEEFYKKLAFLAEGDFAELELLPIHMGISSRSGRLVDAARMSEEASAALDKARYERDSKIVAFRPDPDKYRLFLASKGA